MLELSILIVYYSGTLQEDGLINGNEIYLQDVWAEVLETVKQTSLVEEIVFNTYFIDSKLFSLEDEIAIVTTDSFVTVRVLNEKSKELCEIISAVCKRNISFCQAVLEEEIQSVTDADVLNPTTEIENNTILGKRTLNLNPE